MSFDDSSSSNEYIVDLFLDTPINEYSGGRGDLTSSPTDCLYCGAPLPDR